MGLRAKMHQRRLAKERAKRIRGLGDVELPSLSATVLGALNLLRKGDESLASIGEKLARDGNCSLRTLRLANSSTSGLRRPVETVPHAAALLGRDKLEVILIAAAVSSSLPSESSKHFDPAAFWKLAATRAALARDFAHRIAPADRMVSFTVALLQDMALPVLMIAHGDRYGEVLAQWRCQSGDLSVLEREVFDWDHCEVGLDLASAWCLPEKLCEGIGGHHSSDALPAVALVALLGEEPGECDVDALVTRANEAYGIDADDVVAMVESATIEGGELVSALR